jgi:hypothetical protein
LWSFGEVFKWPPPSERNSIGEGKVWIYFVYIDLFYLGVKKPLLRMRDLWSTQRGRGYLKKETI